VLSALKDQEIKTKKSLAFNNHWWQQAKYEILSFEVKKVGLIKP
jgi:hypothetical protein